MSKYLKQLEKELLEAQIKLESIQLDIDQEVSRLYYEEHPPLIETVLPKGPKATVEGLPYSIFEILLKNHFDVFGLIEKGLAIDINTIKS